MAAAGDAQALPPSDVALPASHAQEVALAAPDSAQPVSLDAAPAGSGRAFQVYRQMGRYLATRDTFFVELNSTTTITVSGKNKQTGGLSRVWYRRPNNVVWTTQSDIGASALAIDGKTCTLYLPVLSKYMVTPLAGAPDAQVAAMSAPYGMLTMGLFASDTTASLEALLTAPPALLPEEEVLGVHCERLTLPTRAGEIQLWVAKGPIPLPVKISSGMSIPAAPGEDNGVESQTEVSFRWRVNVDLPDSTFQLKLPETAVRTEKLGSPVVMARLSGKDPKAGRGSSKSKTKGTSKAEKARTATETRGKKSSAADENLGLAFDPPPGLDQPLPLRSALGNAADPDVPSLGGDDDIVRKAIQGSRPDAVPSGASYQPAQEQQAPPPPASAAKTPSQVLTLLNGQTIDLGAYRGKKAVVLDFWATWCGPCRQSMPVVNQVAQAYRTRNVEFFAVNMAEGNGQIESFLREQGLQIPIAIDPSGALAAAFGVTGIPHLVVIGKDGTVKGTHTGADSKLGQNLQRDLETALR